MTKRFAAGVLLLLAILSPSFAATYHVSPNGDDSATGDADHPLQTISRAADMAGPGDTVLIAPGVYREWVALTRSGRPDKPIVFQAEKTGTAVISGADPLTLWIPVADHPGQYVSDWPHDFIIDTNPDGSPVRNHGAPAPVGCAEQVLWQSHPLRQVMQSDQLAPGCFFADWQYHTLTIWLPGSVDPRTTNVEGCVRPFLMSPMDKYDVLSDTRYITVRGLVLRDAANFAQRGGFILGTGWHVQDCTVEFDNAGGISLNGDDIVVQHCTAQFNGFCGISGSGNNDTLRDCIVHGNNRKGFPPDWEGGGGKFFQTDHLRIIHHTSYDNTGPGLWLDTGNTNYSISDSIFYGNRGLNADWEGSGIFIEISQGPGQITDNISYSNTGAGILLAESSAITVHGNVLADNEGGIELRAMAHRDNYNLDHLTLTHNRFKEWRRAAIGTSLGDWSPQSVADRSISIDGDLFDPAQNKPFITWGDLSLPDLDAIRSALHIEAGGAIESIAFVRKMEDSKTITDPDRPTINKALAGAKIGQTIVLPINCRAAPAEDGTCGVFDWDNSVVTLVVPPELRSAFQARVRTDLTAQPILAQVRLDASANGDMRATLVSIR